MPTTTLAASQRPILERFAQLAGAAARYPMSVWRFCIERRIRSEMASLHATLDDRTLEAFGLRREDIEEILALLISAGGRGRR